VIAKITRGSDPGRIGVYLHGPGRAEEHLYEGRVGGMVIAGTVPVVEGRSPVEWVAEMRAAIDRRPDITKPVWQVSLRAAPGDRVLTDREWADAAQGFASGMGFADHPWVAVRHAADHVHLVVSRVDHTGVVWHGRFDRRQAQQACARLEVEHSLTPAPRTRAVAVSPGAGEVARGRADGQLTQGEWQHAVSSKTTPARVGLAEGVHTAAGLAAGRGRGAFEDELGRLGIAYQANEASTGRMNGYRFADPAHVDPAGVPVWFKASQLDKSLSWAALRVRLEDPPLSPADMPAQRRLQTRAGRDRDLAVARDDARARREQQAPAARTGAHQALTGRNAEWERTWAARAAVDPAKARSDRLRERLHITARVGDAVDHQRLSELVNVRDHQRLYPPLTAVPVRTTPERPGHDTQPSRAYIAPTHDHDHDLGR
jgi:hypothetical protein